MEILTIIVVVAGVLVTLLTSVIKNVDWDYKHKALLATVLSVIAGVAGAFIGVPLAEVGSVVSNLPQFILSVYGSSQLIYQFIFSGSGLERKLAGVGTHDPAPEPDPKFNTGGPVSSHQDHVHFEHNERLITPDEARAAQTLPTPSPPESDSGNEHSQ
jgi:hypothetical protein